MRDFTRTLEAKSWILRISRESSGKRNHFVRATVALFRDYLPRLEQRGEIRRHIWINVTSWIWIKNPTKKAEDVENVVRRTREITYDF